jgi:23S rRNA (guanine745-N1)-methyltransferase
MDEQTAPILLCPCCNEALLPDGRGLRCAQGHAFDRAREGYVNLLRTRDTGDAKVMLQARRQFLDQGHYAPLAEALSQTVIACLSPPPRQPGIAHILDCGCGEGYYLDHLHDSLCQAPAVGDCQLWGLDSSRDAARLAGRRYRDCSFVVADCKDQLPFASHSLAVVLSVFAPRNYEEFARVLRPGGLLLIALPGERHLRELREQLDLIGMEEHKLQHTRERLTAFNHLETRTVHYDLNISAAQAELLITMSPSYRHEHARRLALLRPEARYRATAEFVLLSGRR